MFSVNNQDVPAYNYLNNLLASWTEKELFLTDLEKKIERKEKQELSYIEKYKFPTVVNVKTFTDFIYECELINREGRVHGQEETKMNLKRPNSIMPTPARYTGPLEYLTMWMCLFLSPAALARLRDL